jgi:serine/threonine protein kinase
MTNHFTIKDDGSGFREGDHLGQYRIIRLLGRGGMGQVYEVEHEVLRKRYALKVLPERLTRREGFIDRFKREARVMANLEHPHILPVDDFGRADGRHFLRMELAEGIDTSRLGYTGHCTTVADLAHAADGTLDQGIVVKIITQVLRALRYAHDKGVVHRDIKPANLLFCRSPEGKFLHVKVSDFGLVRLVGADWLRSRTEQSVSRSMSLGELRTVDGAGNGDVGSSTRSLLGTYAYMSPEQKRGEEADETSDLYALGLMAFRLLTGEQELSFTLPSERHEDIASEWDEVIRRSVKTVKTDRYASAEAMRGAIRKIGPAIGADDKPNGKCRDSEGREYPSTGGSPAELNTREIDQLMQRARELEGHGMLQRSLDALWEARELCRGTRCHEDRLNEIEESVVRLKEKRKKRRSNADQGDSELGRLDFKQDMDQCEKVIHNGGSSTDYLRSVHSGRLPEWQKAASRNVAEAQYFLGRCYYEGFGVERDPSEGMRLCREAANKGLRVAQLSLAGSYYSGTGVAQDREEAVKWYRAAAMQGYAVGQNHLAACYANGLGVEEDHTMAAKWYRKAADQGYAPAQYNLGLCYVNGKGLHRNRKKAGIWLEKAAEQGSAKAKKRLDRLRNSVDRGAKIGVTLGLILGVVIIIAAASDGADVGEERVEVGIFTCVVLSCVFGLVGALVEWLFKKTWRLLFE